MKTIDNITLYDLMAEDLDVWLTKSKSGFHIEIDDENGFPILNDNDIHPFAADSFANFCRRYLACYDNATKKDAA